MARHKDFDWNLPAGTPNHSVESIHAASSGFTEEQIMPIFHGLREQFSLMEQDLSEADQAPPAASGSPTKEQ